MEEQQLLRQFIAHFATFRGQEIHRGRHESTTAQRERVSGASLAGTGGTGGYPQRSVCDRSGGTGEARAQWQRPRLRPTWKSITSDLIAGVLMVTQGEYFSCEMLQVDYLLTALLENT